MTLRIASTINKEKENFLVLAGVGLTEAPSIGMWKETTRMSLMQNAIQNLTEIPTCPRLRTLFLPSNHLGTVSNNFFHSMASLRVLILSYNRSLENLPLGIFNLVSLQHLDISWTGITTLPIELKYLVNLKCLNLEYTFRLSRIPQQVISDLKMLRALRMFECGFNVELEADSILFGDSEVLVEELLVLKHLNLLTITLQSFGALQRLLSYCRLGSISTQCLCLRHLNNSNSLSVFAFASLRHLRTLQLYFNDLEELKIDAGELKRIREICGFHSLQKVFYKILKIEARDMACTCSQYQACPRGLTKFEEHPLKRLECAELKELPLDCNHGLEQKIIIKGQEHWWNELQWDDLSTQNAFLPCFESLY
ncbi:hypothetical protein CISIN_1g038551mg [Citrus sinensis]|uniref:Disease resistance R13L4/SHOC-2-like LRR domain-containing protein n=1 Tax=Citrus sinensis TaxID=2711 RepID=A0A067EG86_CITSI|nr:hypothetical protein CISIN_1g038551mg [Citrus sinensis]